MNTLKSLQKIIDALAKSVLDGDKLPNTIENVFLKTLADRNVSTTLKTTLLVVFAAGILAEVFFVTLISGLAILRLIFN